MRMDEFEMRKEIENRPYEVVVLKTLSNPHVYFHDSDNMSSRQRRRHERTRMRKGRK